MKKIAYVLAVLMLCVTSVAFGARWGSNIMGIYPDYPNFSGGFLYRPSRAEVQAYVDEAKEYVEACDNDIETIRNKRNTAVRKANEAISNYNLM